MIGVTPSFLLRYNMNCKEKLYNLLWLQVFLRDEQEEEDEETSSDEEENIILQTALIRRLNTRYLKSRLYHVVKSKHWWQNVLPFYDTVRFKKLLRMLPYHFQQLADLIWVFAVVTGISAVLVWGADICVLLVATSSFSSEEVKVATAIISEFCIKNSCGLGAIGRKVDFRLDILVRRKVVY
jgi:hypothetical protein